MRQPQDIRVLGLKVHTVDMAEALDFIDEALTEEGASQIITLNAEIAYAAFGDEELTRMINSAALVTADGTGILWAAKRYGAPLRERVCGIDLLTAMMERYRDGSHGFYFLGSKPEVAAAAAKKIRETYPRLDYRGFHDGYFGRSREDAEAMADTVAASGADILVVAMGAPYQDQWIAAYAKRCGVKAAIGVGGSLDVISGTVKRAPVFFQKLRIEWLYRLISEPSRWRRMLALPRFMRLVKKEIKKNAR